METNLEDMTIEEIQELARISFKDIECGKPDEEWWKDPEWAIYTRELLNSIKGSD